MQLTQQQLDDYERDGILVFPELFSEVELFSVALFSSSGPHAMSDVERIRSASKRFMMILV